MASHAGPGRHGGLDGVRGGAILAVMTTHVCWVFVPDLVIGNFAGLGLPDGIAAFPFYNVLVANVFAVALLMAVSGYAAVLAWSAHDSPPALPLALVRRYLRLVLPALVVGAVVLGFASGFGNLHRQASTLIYDFAGYTWLSQFWSEPPTAGTLAAEFLLGQVEHESAVLMPLWMMADLFLGSALCLCVLRAAPQRGRVPVLLVVAALVFIVRPLAAAVVLGAVIAAARQAGLLALPGLGLRILIAGLALFAGLNPEGAGSGGLALQAWYAPWLAQGWGLPLTACAGAVLLFAVLPDSPGTGGLRRALAVVGRNSYGLFLLHWPVLLIVSCGLFVALEPGLGPGLATLAAVLVTIPVLAVATGIFSRFVERPLLGLVGRIGA